MTILLKDYNPAATPPRRGPDAQPTGQMAGIAAATTMKMRDTNANFLRQREVIAEQNRVAAEAAKRLGMEAMMPTGAVGILSTARKEAKIDPKKWADLDLSDEGIEARVTDQRIADDAEDQAVLDMMPKGRGLAEFAGSMTGAMADVRNVPFLLLGGGGTLARVMLSEAALNVAAEGVTLPSQFDVAEELGKADPNVAAVLGEAAVFGAALGGIGYGVVRGFQYWREANRVEVPERISPERAQAGIQAAQEAIESGADPIAAAGRIATPEALNEAPAVDPVALQPIAPDPITPPRLDEPVQSPAPPTEPSNRPTSADEAPPPPLRDDPVTPDSTPDWMQREIDAVQEEADKIERKATGGRRYPVMTSMRRLGMRFDPESPDGRELYNILGGPRQANRTLPGLFRKASTPGRKNTSGLDNMVASEWEKNWPGIREATGTPWDADYLDRDGVLDLIRREAGGDNSWMTAVQEANSLRRGASPSNFQPRGFDPADYRSRFPDAWQSAMAEDVKEALYDIDRGLLDEELADIVADAQQRGGSADDLLQDHYARQMEWVRSVDARTDEGSALEPDPLGGDPGLDGREPFPGETGGGGADRRGGNETGGVQSQIPGTDRIQTGVAQAQAAEIAARQLQSKIRRLDQNRIEDEVNSLFGQQHADLFSDVTSPEAEAFIDAQILEFRDLVETLDPEVNIVADDGRALTNLTDVLDEIEEMDALVREFASCVAGGAE